MKSDKARKNFAHILEVIKSGIGHLRFDKATYMQIQHWLSRYKNGLTFNKYKGMVAAMYNAIERWDRMGNVLPIQVKLPMDRSNQFNNPAELFHTKPTLSRERIASADEIEKVRQWCVAHDPGMWELVFRAIVSGLRKGDLQAIQGMVQVRGIQEKTGREFSLPLDFSKPASFTNFHRRWVACLEGSPLKDFHWHDWRHQAATMLKNLGFSTSQIQEFCGHATEKQTQTYINRRSDRLKPLVESLMRELKVQNFA